MKQNIFMLSATGIGCTPKSAFDDALYRVGIHNFNLVPLSSVIPPDTNIIKTDTYNRDILPGTMQPVVMATHTSEQIGQVISAGIGWRLATEGGVFVEISGHWDKELTKSKLEASINELAQRRSDWNWLQPCNTEVIETSVIENAACVLVCAVYDFTEIWGKKQSLEEIIPLINNKQTTLINSI